MNENLEPSVDLVIKRIDNKLMLGVKSVPLLRADMVREELQFILRLDTRLRRAAQLLDDEGIL